MANRQPTGGIAPNLPRPVYEDLRPTSEWKREEQSDLLLVYLPGFVKEQLKVSMEGNTTLRIRGERVVGGNTWNRFEEEFCIPKDCNTRGIRAKFEVGTLTITIPKKSGAKEAAKTTHEAPSSQDTADNPRHGKEDTHPKTNLPSDATSKVDEKVVPSPSPQKAASTTKPKNGRDNNTPPKIASNIGEGKQKDDTGLEEPKMPEIGLGKTIEKEKGSSEKGKESIEPGKVIEKTVKKEKEEIEGTTCKLKKCKQAMKGLVSLEEERALVVNVGAAILVTVALGAYIAYTWASSGRAEP